MLNKTLSILCAALLLAGLAAGPVLAQHQPQEVRQTLEQRDRQIKALLGDKTSFTSKQREQLKDVVNAGIDFEAMSRQALGTHWGNLTAQQQADFVSVFSEIVRAQSLSNLEVYRAKVTYEDVTVKDQTARVTTTTIYKDVPTQVIYVMGRRGDAWLVQDIILDEVSTAEGYARAFQAVVRKKGFDALMSSLHKKLDKINAAE